MRAQRDKGKVAAFVVALALTWSAGAAAHDAHEQPADKPAGEAAAAQETAAPVPLEIGGPFSLIDHGGRVVTDRDFRGAYMLVFFGYANCPGICPVGLRNMVEAVDLMGEQGARVAPILITVDPANDTPDNLAPAVAKIHPRLVGLTGTAAQLSAVARAYGTSAKPVGRSWLGVDIFAHGTFIYLMGPDGGFLALFPPVMDPEAMAGAIGRYMS